MIFYNPGSQTAEELLRFAQKVSQKYQSQVTVLGLAMSEDVENVRGQREQLQLTFPILCGTGLRKSYGIDATPKLMLLDAEGIVRGEFIGWGRETPHEAVEEMRRWMPAH